MEILLTALSLAALCGCFLAFTRTQRVADEASMWARSAEKSALALKSERDRITVLERELDALRRELRKLSGKFHASQREVPDDIQEAEFRRKQIDFVPYTAPLGVCENWLLAQRDGPRSEAASCDCEYCVAQREQRAQLRKSLVPKGAQATAATAKLNAGKP